MMHTPMNYPVIYIRLRRTEPVCTIRACVCAKAAIHIFIAAVALCAESGIASTAIGFLNGVPRFTFSIGFSNSIEIQ